MQVLKNRLTCTTRVKLKTVTISVIVSSLILLIYQVVIVYKITDSTPDLSEAEHFKNKQPKINHFGSDSPESEISPNRIHFVGTLKNDKKYIPNINGRILCDMDSFEIDVTKVNDDYCDCPADGMDEPGTNSCKNGRFFCNYQPDSKNCKYTYTIFLINHFDFVSHVVTS